jgi:hypothetical protein
MSAKKKRSPEQDRAAIAEQRRVIEGERKALAEQRRALEREWQALAECEPNAPIERKRSDWVKIAERVASLIGIYATLFGVYASFVGLETRISMSADAPINSSDIMSAPFIVSNDGQLNVHDVTYGCIDRRILSDTGSTIIANGPYKKVWMGGFTTPSMVADIISPTDKQAFTCPMPLIPAGHVTYGDMIIAVSYRPDWWPFRKQIHKRFATALDAERKPVRWYEQPMPNE